MAAAFAQFLCTLITNSFLIVDIRPLHKLALFIRFFRVNKFYKKGCQEKKLRLDRRREDLFLDIQPTVCKSASRFEREVLVLACLRSLWGSSADGDDANRVWKG